MPHSKDASPYREEVRKFVEAVKSGDLDLINLTLDHLMYDQMIYFTDFPQVREALVAQNVMDGVAAYFRADGSKEMSGIAHSIESFKAQGLDPNLVATKRGFVVKSREMDPIER